MKARKLGRGLDALMTPWQPVPPPESLNAPLPTQIEHPSSRSTGILEVDLDAVEANPQQPRVSFEEAALRELADSIRSCGVIQPILVRRYNGKYQLLAGERRWRAARLAGLDAIPAIVKTASDQEAVEIALIENVNREDLNPIERATAYRTYIEAMGQTQEQASERLGHDRTTIANYLRLLDLPEELRGMLADRRLSMGHARALLGLSEPAHQVALARRVVAEGLSVRRVEELVRRHNRPLSQRAPSDSPRSAVAREWEEQLSGRLGTKVVISTTAGGKAGTIKIEFYSLDDFDRIVAAIRPVGPREV